MQWRDSANCRVIESGDNPVSWQVADGWRTDVLQKLNYRPFIEPCFGDSVAAGVLSTFIYRTKLALQNVNDPELPRIIQVLDELDLYRPTSAAVARIIQETQREKTLLATRKIIEKNLYQAIVDWLNWDFTLNSATRGYRLGLRVARGWLKITGWLQWQKIQLKVVKYCLKVLNIIDSMVSLTVYSQDGATFKDIQTFPTFQQAFWERGFRLHCEGHTHIPLQSDAKVEYPGRQSSIKSTNFTYVNDGTWRDQIVDKENDGYRRRGVGRSLFVEHLTRTQPDPARQFCYFTQDDMLWSDYMDQW